jgi:tRNA (guanosine-2'-O-)-methyltransferase
MDRREQIAHLSQFVSPRRLDKFHRVLDRRSRYITVVLEDIYQPHNASAVLRSCDGFGFQDVHIIENRNSYKINPKVELGTSGWLSITRYRDGDYNSIKALEALRSRGYRIVATGPPEKASTALEDFALSAGPAALFFGNELDGLTEAVMAAADERLFIPMFGFVESFNLSVACAVTLHHLRHRLNLLDIDIHLSEEEREELLLQWLLGKIKKWRNSDNER